LCAARIGDPKRFEDAEFPRIRWGMVTRENSPSATGITTANLVVLDQTVDA